MNRRAGLVSMAVVTSLIFCGAQTSTQGCANSQPAPSHTGAEAAGIAIVAGVVVGAVVLVAVHHAHHTIKGCVSAGPNGVVVQDSGNMKVYALSGVTADVKVGDEVRVHGARAKQKKGDLGDPVFVVEKLNKDYGPCKASATSMAKTTP
jgi:hypothetical protein